MDSSPGRFMAKGFLLGFSVVAGAAMAIGALAGLAVLLGVFHP